MPLPAYTSKRQFSGSVFRHILEEHSRPQVWVLSIISGVQVDHSVTLAPTPGHYYSLLIGTHYHNTFNSGKTGTMLTGKGERSH